MAEIPTSPRLTVVIPAFNEEKRLDSTLARIREYLVERGESFEILVVDDGSTDGTAAVVQRFAGPDCRLLRLERNSGKGTAVRTGVLASRGRWVLITDADLSAPIEELETLEGHAGKADLILGSRAQVGSRIGRRQPFFREMMGKTFNLIIRSLGLSDLRDTQCGFKLIRGEVARLLFARMTVDRFAFDIELVWLARALGYRVIEVGVVWRHSPRSTVRPLQDSPVMFWDVLKIRCRRRPRA